MFNIAHFTRGFIIAILIELNYWFNWTKFFVYPGNFELNTGIYINFGYSKRKIAVMSLYHDQSNTYNIEITISLEILIMKNNGFNRNE